MKTKSASTFANSIALQPNYGMAAPTETVSGDRYEQDQLSRKTFIAIQQARRILLHWHGCSSLRVSTGQEGMVMSFDSADAAKEWLIAAKHSWQNCRTCGGAKKNRDRD